MSRLVCTLPGRYAYEHDDQVPKVLNLSSIPIFPASAQLALPYSWTQDLASSTLTVPLPAGTRAKSLLVEIKKKSLKVGTVTSFFLSILFPYLH